MKKVKFFSLGFTLVEVLVITAVAGISGVLLLSLLVQNNSLVYQQTTKINQSLNINDLAAELNESIRLAQAVVIVNPIGSPQYSSGLETLVLAVPSIDSLGNNIVGSLDYVVFVKDPTNQNILRKIVFPNLANQSQRLAQDKVLATRLSKLEFKYLDDTNSQVAIPSTTKILYVVNLSEKVNRQDQTSSTSAQISLRNY